MLGRPTPLTRLLPKIFLVIYFATVRSRDISTLLEAEKIRAERPRAARG